MANKTYQYQLKSIRVTKLRITQAEAADLCGITASHLQKIELCKRVPSAPIAQKIASVYQIPLEGIVWKGSYEDDN